MSQFYCKFQEPADEPALARLAERLADTEYSSWPLQVESGRPLPGAPGNDTFAIRRRRLLLCEDDEVRALHNFFEHQLYLDGQPQPFVWPNGPLSEGIVNPKYAVSWLMVLQHSLKLQPLHLTMGGSSALQQILARLGWKRSANMDRFLLPLRPAKVLREMAWFQRQPARRLAARLVAQSGLANLLGHAFSGRKLKRQRSSEYRAELCDAFGPWADDVWREVMPSYGAVTRRDAATMNRLYRPGDARFRRFVVFNQNRPIGWFLFTTRVKPTAEMDLGFGGLRVGALVDTFCLVKHAPALLSLAVEQMCREDVDLVFGHWTHRSWDQALRDVGFLRKRTTLPFFVSPAGAALLFTPGRPLESCHFTDGDCDGPYYVQADTDLRQACAA